MEEGKLLSDTEIAVAILELALWALDNDFEEVACHLDYSDTALAEVKAAIRHDLEV